MAGIFPFPGQRPTLLLHFLSPTAAAQLSFPPALMLRDSFPASHRCLVGISGTWGRLWLGQGRTGLWAGTHLGLSPSPGSSNRHRCERRINICKREKPLELLGLKAQRMQFPSPRGTGSSYFSSICNTVDPGSLSIFLADITMLVTLFFTWPAVYLTLRKECFILRSSDLPYFLMRSHSSLSLAECFQLFCQAFFFFLNLNWNY